MNLELDSPHPTRYIQIIELASLHKLSPNEQLWLASLHKLSPNEQLWLPEDQKYSSTLARVSYKKLCSIDVTRKGQECMRKL